MIGLIGGGGATLVTATVLMRSGVEPFATWYYPFAWYSTLLVMEAAVARRNGRFYFLGRPGFALSLFGWSIPFWLFFELLNFRLVNWYYVFVPDGAVARWTGIAISFATVLAAIFVAERALRTYGPWREDHARSTGDRARAGEFSKARSADRSRERSRLTTRHLRILQALGLACILLPMIWPRGLFPLVWIGVTLIADPWVCRRDPERSLLADLERGRPRRVLRLLFGGMAIWLLWELFNVGARGKWIYTVPGLEELKLFEMPLLGFLGFPFLALEGWSAYQALVVAGLAVDPNRGRAVADETGDQPYDPSPMGVLRGGLGRQALRSGWTLAIGTLAAVFSILVLRGMETETISSRTPRLEAVDPRVARALHASGYEVFDLAKTEPEELATEIGIESARAKAWIEWARLVTLRGIGTANAARLRAAGVTSVRELAGISPEELTARLAETGPPVPGARVGVWGRAAGQAVGSGP